MAQWKKLCLIVLATNLCLLNCGGADTDADNDTDGDMDYRQEMRDFVIGISEYAKGLEAGFVVIPQNGHQLVTEDGDTSGTVATDYLGAIDGVGREDLFYGYDSDDEATDNVITSDMVAFMDIAENNGVEVLATDYCSTESKMDDSYQQNEDHGYISFAADHRELDNIPTYPAAPYNENTDNIATLGDAQNFLYILNSDGYANKAAFVNALQATSFDVIITDLYYDGSEELTQTDLDALKTKANGGSRLVVAYMSIGEAEDYRYYWDSAWVTSPPTWLDEENPDWAGNYKVQYWNTGWQEIIYGNDDSYLKKIIDAGFDGVYLDIIDAFEYYEES